MNAEREQLAAYAAGLRQGVSEGLGRAWWFILLRGLLAVALGIAVLIWPKLSVGLLVTLIGVFCLLDGISGIIAAVRGIRRDQYLLGSVVSLAVGVVLVFWPGITARVLLMLLGAWALLQGLSLFVSARRSMAEGDDRKLAMWLGVATAVVGVIFLIWPSTGVVTIAWLVGLAASLIGALLLFPAFRLKKAKVRLDSAGVPAR